MKILIKGGRVIDPGDNIDDILDVLIDDARITKVAKNIAAKAETIIDARGHIVMPGLVDMHVHLREPGREDKETVASGTTAALKGGVTSVLAMPNTHPAIDCIENVRLLKEIVAKTAQANVFIAASVTKGRLGSELTAFTALKKEGVVAVTDDGASVDDEGLFLEALQRARQQDLLVISHCEDKTLSGHGVVNRGFIATRLGLRGISSESEYKRVERDILLAKRSDAHVHIAHVSCKESVAFIAKAKKEGVKLTAETCPHYLALSEEDVLGYDTNFKMNPPLRSKEDREALRQALANGTIDVISSDHAPHTENEKDIEFDRAEFGVIGLETELAVSITELLQTNLLDWPGLVRRLSRKPAEILGIDKGTLGEGKDADVAVVDPQKEWVVRKELILSKSKNSAFLGKTLRGVVTHTICSGKLVYRSSL